MGLSEAAADERPAFRARTVIALVLVGVFAFSAFVTLAAYAPDLDRDSACRSNVYSRCAIGFAGLQALIQEDGVPVVVSDPEGTVAAAFSWVAKALAG